MNQNKKSIIVVDDIEGWLMMEILGKILDLNQFNVVRYNQESNDLLLTLQRKPDIFILCGHSNYGECKHSTENLKEHEGYLYFGNRFRIDWKDCVCEHLLTCFYDSQNANHDDYIRLPGFLEDRTPVLYKIDGLREFAMAHNNKYRKKLAIVKQNVHEKQTDLIDTYLKIMMPFIKKIEIDYETLDFIKQ